jgi:hypothetical protein
LRRITVIVALAACAACPAATHADRVSRGPVVQATDVVAGERTIRIVHSVRRTNTLLPPYLIRFELQFPPGTRARTAGFERCDLSELHAKGVKACPPGARVGTGTATGRTIFDPGGIGGTVRLFNGKRVASRPAVLMYIRPQKGPTFVLVGKIGGGKTGLRLDFNIPPIKTLLAGREPDSVISDLVLKFDSGFVTAPCPGTYRVKSYFMDEPVFTTSDRARCD